MDALTNGQIDDLTEQLISVTNHRVYQNVPHGPAIEPHKIYLYYITDPYVKPEPVPDVYVIDYGRPIHNLSVVRDLVTTAANRICDPDDDYKPCKSGFNSFEWRTRTYIVIAMDSEGWFFRKGAGVVFDPSGGKTPNHTFFDGFDMDIAVKTEPGGPKQISITGFVNYMVADQYGSRLDEKERQEFKFWLFPKDARKSIPEPIDPGGTNLGPPAPPP